MFENLSDNQKKALIALGVLVAAGVVYKYWYKAEGMAYTSKYPRREGIAVAVPVRTLPTIVDNSADQFPKEGLTYQSDVVETKMRGKPVNKSMNTMNMDVEAEPFSLDFTPPTVLHAQRTPSQTSPFIGYLAGGN